MIARSYLDFCEKLWSSWLAEELQATLPSSISGRFQLTHAPEPYIRFGAGSRPVFFLLTNPGDGRHPVQTRTNILAKTSCVTGEQSYYDAALNFGNWYRAELKQAAGTRIKKMDYLANKLGGDCFVQFESIPFHSKSLPKRRLPDVVQQTKLLSEYASCLTEALRPADVPAVVVLSGVSSSQSITSASVDGSEWLKWQASLLEVQSDELKVFPLCTNEKKKITVAFLYKKVGTHLRGFVLSMGQNGFPRKEGLDHIVAALPH